VGSARRADGMVKKFKRIPLKRLGTTAEVSSLVNYLLSDGAAYITGQTLVIDGGMSC